jgi:hypothetical protein
MAGVNINHFSKISFKLSNCAYRMIKKHKKGPAVLPAGPFAKGLCFYLCTTIRKVWRPLASCICSK